MDSQKRDVRQLWQVEQAPTVTISETELRAREAEFSRKIKRRNLREYIVTGAAVVAFAVMPLPNTASVVASRLLVTTAALACVWHLRKYGSPPPPVAPDAPFAEAIAHHRAALVRQRDLLRMVPYVHVAPVFATAVMLALSLESAGHPDLRLGEILWQDRTTLAPILAYVVALWGGIVVWNRRGAKKLERQIEALGTDTTR